MATRRLEIRLATAAEEDAARACLLDHEREMRGTGASDWARESSGERFSVLALCGNKVVAGLIGRVSGIGSMPISFGSKKFFAVLGSAKM
jgi:hypothetical protein